MNKQLGLVLISLLLLVSLVAGYDGYRNYRGSFDLYGADFSDTINGILDWFIDNPGWVDAIALLVVFLVLGKSVFKDYFGSKTLYITVAIALTVGVLLWERQTGISLILNSGPAGIVILMIAGFMFLYYMLFGLVENKWLAVGVAYIIFYNYLTYITYYTPEYIPDFIYRIAEYLIFGWGDLMTVILLIMIPVVIYFFIKSVSGRGKRDMTKPSMN